MKRVGSLLLALLTAFSLCQTVLAEGETTQRITVYQEDFESGIGKFSTGAEAMITHQEDGTGNHYVMVKVNPDKAEEIATYGRKANEAGRWGTEFFTWQLQVSPKNFVMQNGRRYQFLFEGSHVQEETFSKPGWGTSVLTVAKNTLWDGGAKSEAYTGTGVGAAIDGKDGWFAGYTSIDWLKNVGFGVTREGNQTDGYTYTGESKLSYFHVRTQLAHELATVMAKKKFYCGKGTGLTNAKGESKTGSTFGSEYQFTLTRDDFYGDEAIFDGLTTEDEINAKKDEYIYETGKITLKTYSLGGDCSFLYSKKRIAAFQDYLKNNLVGYAMDNFTMTADAAVCPNRVTVGEHGSVVAVTNPVIGESVIVNEGKSQLISVNDYFGVTYTITPAENYHVEQVLYGDTDVTAMVQNNQFTIAADEIDAKALSVTFEADAPKTPEVTKTEMISGTYEGKPAQMLYMQVSEGTDGFAIQGLGAELANSKNETMRLTAKNASGADATEAGGFGIRVFGAAFTQGEKYYLTPFVTFRNSDGTEETKLNTKTEFDWTE